MPDRAYLLFVVLGDLHTFCIAALLCEEIVMFAIVLEVLLALVRVLFGAVATAPQATFTMACVAKATPANVAFFVVPDSFMGVTAGYELSRDVFIVSEGCIKALTQEELLAVMCHEMGHQFHRQSHIMATKSGCDARKMVAELEADAYAVAWGYKAPLKAALLKIFDINTQQPEGMPDDVYLEYKQLTWVELMEPRIKALS